MEELKRKRSNRHVLIQRNLSNARNASEHDSSTILPVGGIMTLRRHDVTTSRHITYVAIVRIRFSRGGIFLLCRSAPEEQRELPTPPVNRFITGRLDFAGTYVECARFDRDLRHGNSAISCTIPCPLGSPRNFTK